MENTRPKTHYYLLALIILTGELIYFLPFGLARVFRPTLLEVLDLSNREFGKAISFYGIIATISYFPGGLMADLFSGRKLITASLLMTGVSGIFFLKATSYPSMALLYAFWGISTVTLFWAAFIKATRQWGGNHKQGAAFGLLEGGRGICAALLSALLVAVYGAMVPEGADIIPLEEKARALQTVVYIVSAAVFGIGLVTWRYYPKTDPVAKKKTPKPSAKEFVKILALPAIWFQAVITLCAYVGFKTLDMIPLYAKDVLELDEMDSYKVVLATFFIRPAAAILAGFVADKVDASLGIIWSFVTFALGALILSLGLIAPGMVVAFLITASCSFIGMFALRGLYFAVMKESKIPVAYTGMAVGAVSLVGYSPSVFIGPVTGFFLDKTPGGEGVLHVYVFIATFAIIGLVTSVLFRGYIKRNAKNSIRYNK